MDIILRKNEAEINENVAKGLLIVFACIFPLFRLHLCACL